ncbi:DUF6483 family protein [Cohnella thermotolerans]|uniref:DUF6483 family protein n=1 Tax=Cohnella thermotolerans TaxID=329858 RepID=UPI00041B61B8|nr:DUF6483 family protein [Cohnella thermotolerans]
MYDRDYLMRLISQTTTMLGRLMGLKEQKKQEEAMTLIDEFLSRELRLRSRLALGLSDEDLLQMLSVGGVPNYESVAILAVFLKEEGDLLSGTGQTGDAVPRYEKALRLMLRVLEEHGPVQGLGLEERVGQLLGRLAPYEKAAATKRAVWRWHESQGRYAEAENLLYELYEDEGATPEEGRSFYERLAKLSDEELEKGDLPRSELLEGRRQWDALAGETAS